MKSWVKMLSVLLLLGALVGASRLVKNNQENRGRAAAQDAAISIFPDYNELKTGENVNLEVWVDTGSENDKMDGVELEIEYQPELMKLIKIEPQSGYVLVNDRATADNNGVVTLKLINMGGEGAGTVNVVNLDIWAKSAGEGEVFINSAKMMIGGQSKLWEVESLYSSIFVIDGEEMPEPTAEPTVEPTVVQPSPTIRPTETVVPPTATLVPTRIATPTIIPTQIPEPTKQVNLSCGWCGTECIDNRLMRMCATVEPPKGWKCMVSNGVCVIRKSELSGCDSDEDCPENFECYQPPMPACPIGSECVDVMPKKYCREIGVQPSIIPTVRPKLTVTTLPTPTVATVGYCGTRCFRDGECGLGRICAPIWWPCGEIPSWLLTKLQNNIGLTQDEVKLMITICPGAKNSLPASYISMTTVNMPIFYGMCRKPSCVNRMDCNCTTGTPAVTTVRPTPTIVTPKPTVSPTMWWQRLFGGWFRFK